MRARPATSEVRKPAAQLVAYGGSRAGSMREGAHPGRIAAYPAQNLSSRGHMGRFGAPFVSHAGAGLDGRGRRLIRGSRSSKSPNRPSRKPPGVRCRCHGEFPGQPWLVGPQRGRVPDRARHVPRRRPLRVVPRGPRRGGGRAARPAGGPEGPGRPGDRRRRGPVLALAGRAGRPPGRPGPLPPPAPARAAHRRCLPPGVRRRRARSPSRTAPSTWPARRTARCPSSPIRCWSCGRSAGCCAPAAASSSR